MEAATGTQLDKQADFEGKLAGKDVQISGRFKGEIQITGRLVLGDESRVDAKIKADTAVIGGEFRGEIAVRSLVLLEKARVEGMIEAQTLAVKEGAQLNASVNAGVKEAAQPSAPANAGANAGASAGTPRATTA